VVALYSVGYGNGLGVNSYFIVSDVEMDRWLNSYYIQCPGSGQGVKSVMEMDKEVIL
jgi:hypothetical protein